MVKRIVAMNEEQRVAAAMIYILTHPQVAYENTVDGLTDAVFFSNTIHVESDVHAGCIERADWNTVYAATKEADEWLRAGKTAKDYYGKLIIGK